MCEESVEIITNFILGLYPEEFRTKGVSDVVRMYVTNKNNFDAASSFCKLATGTIEPIERLKKILDSCSRSASSTMRNPPPGKKTRPWTLSEDNRLLAGILKFGPTSWPQISKFVGNGRTRPQCQQRYFRALNPKISKENWSEDEDQRLIELVKEYGEKKWTHIGEILGNRTDVQCRYRYKQLQRKMVGSTIFDHQFGNAANTKPCTSDVKPVEQPSPSQNNKELNVCNVEEFSFNDYFNNGQNELFGTSEAEKIESFFMFNANDFSPFELF